MFNIPVNAQESANRTMSNVFEEYLLIQYRVQLAIKMELHLKVHFKIYIRMHNKVLLRLH